MSVVRYCITISLVCMWFIPFPPPPTPLRSLHSTKLSSNLSHAFCLDDEIKQNYWSSETPLCSFLLSVIALVSFAFEVLLSSFFSVYSMVISVFWHAYFTNVHFRFSNFDVFISVICMKALVYIFKIFPVLTGFMFPSLLFLPQSLSFCYTSSVLVLAGLKQHDQFWMILAVFWFLYDSVCPCLNIWFWMILSVSVNFFGSEMILCSLCLSFWIVLLDSPVYCWWSGFSFVQLDWPLLTLIGRAVWMLACLFNSLLACNMYRALYQHCTEIDWLLFDLLFPAFLLSCFVISIVCCIWFKLFLVGILTQASTGSDTFCLFCVCLVFECWRHLGWLNLERFKSVYFCLCNIDKEDGQAEGGRMT